MNLSSRVVHDAGRPGLGQIIPFIVLDWRQLDIAVYFRRPEIDIDREPGAFIWFIVLCALHTGAKLARTVQPMLDRCRGVLDDGIDYVDC
jgi:hypothetical protein